MKNFQQLSGAPGILRGSAPSEEEVRYLKEVWKVKRIVSLDLSSANRISQTCAKLGIHQIIFPLEPTISSQPQIDRLKNSIVTLLDTEQPVFIHCLQGQDRTGLAIALYRVKKGWSPAQALEEARRFNFGTSIPGPVRALYEKSIAGDAVKKAQMDATTLVRNQFNESNQLGPEIYHSFYDGETASSRELNYPTTNTEEHPVAEMRRTPQNPVTNHYDTARADDDAARADDKKRKKQKRLRKRLIEFLLKDRNEAFPTIGQFRDCNPMFRTLGPTDISSLSPGNISYNY